MPLNPVRPMVSRPVVFISATSDLRSTRDLVGKILFSLGYEPHWQNIKPTDGGEMLNILRRWVDQSALVIQLVGKRFGAEPPAPTQEFGRVSYTQFEARYAEQCKKTVIYYFLEQDFPTDSASAEDDTKAGLQEAYKQSLIAANKLRHESIKTSQDLELSVYKLRDELAGTRALADRRFRRLLRLTAALFVGGTAVAGVVLLALSHLHGVQTQLVASSTHVADELAAIRNELREILAPRALGPGESAPAPLPPGLLDRAKALLARGTGEDQALATTPWAGMTRPTASSSS